MQNVQLMHTRTRVRVRHSEIENKGPVSLRQTLGSKDDPLPAARRLGRVSRRWGDVGEAVRGSWRGEVVEGLVRGPAVFFSVLSVGRHMANLWA